MHVEWSGFKGWVNKELGLKDGHRRRRREWCMSGLGWLSGVGLYLFLFLFNQYFKLLLKIEKVF